MSEDYQKAYKAGLRRYRRALSQGSYPYPPALDDILPQALQGHKVSVGVMEVPLSDVIGTVQRSRQDAFSTDFYPLLQEGSEFADKWCALCRAQFEEGIRDAIKVYEYLKRFYVLEGNKRVSVSRYVDAPSIRADITRILPEQYETSYPWYREFLAFFAIAPTYEIDCREEGSYAGIAEAYGGDLVTPFDKDRLSILISGYRRFAACFQDRQDERFQVAPGDGFLVYLDIYGPHDLTHLSEETLVARVNKLRAEIALLSSDRITYVEQPQDVTGARPHFSLFKKEPVYSKSHPLKAALIHERMPDNSAWVYSHELGKNHINFHFDGVVQCDSVMGCDTDEKTAEAIDAAISDGAEIIFTTSPTQMPETLKSAIHYPQVKFLNCSVNLPHTAVRTYETRLYEAKLLMGALAASYSDNHRITYIADLPIYGAVANINAFALGAAMADPKAEIILHWSAEQGFDQERIVRESDSDVFSGPDLNRPEYYSREFGVYRMTPDGSPENLAMPIRHWGRYYELLLDSVLRGSYEAAAGGFDVSAVNYWWGLESGVVDVLPGSRLSDGAKRLLHALRFAVSMRVERPFGQMDHKEIILMNALQENIRGYIPSPEALNDEARRLTDIVGLKTEASA